MSNRNLHTRAMIGSVAVLAALFVASVATARPATPIAAALDETKTYDFVTIEGVVTDTKGQHLYRIEDESGSMIVLIKDHFVREEGPIRVNDHLRLSGRIEEKKLDRDQRGMMVSQVERLEEKIGASGASNPAAKADGGVVPIDRSALPAAPADSTDPMIERKTSDEFVARARTQVQAYRKAEATAVDAGQAYARVARDASTSDADEAAALERLQAAEAKVVELRGRFPALLDEARAQGVDEGVIEMIEQTSGMR